MSNALGGVLLQYVVLQVVVHVVGQLCCPKVAPELGPLSAPIPGGSTRRCWGCFLSHHPGKLYSLARRVEQAVSVIPASSQFNPFLQLGLLALHSRSFLGHRLPLLSSYNLNFSFSSQISKAGPCNG